MEGISSKPHHSFELIMFPLILYFSLFIYPSRWFPGCFSFLKLLFINDMNYFMLKSEMLLCKVLDHCLGLCS